MASKTDAGTDCMEGREMTTKTELREEKAATPHKELIKQLLDSRIPKTEREHAAAREIEVLRAEVDRWKRINAEQVNLHVKAEIRCQRLADALEMCLDMEERPEVIERAKAALDALVQEDV